MDDNETSRRMVEVCYMKKKTTLNPIVDWLEEDVWEFLNDVAKVPHCCLYDQGFTRLGCIGCPLQGRDGMLRDFERWPRYKQLYIKAFDQMIKNHPGEIKVASGEMVENVSGGGYGDSFRVALMEQLTKEDRPTMRAEYLKRDTADPAMNQWIQKADGTGGGTPRPMDGRTDLRPVAVVTAKQPQRTSTTQTCPERETNKHGLPKQWWLTATAEENFQLAGGGVLFQWWLWILREQNKRDEPNPIHREYST